MAEYCRSIFGEALLIDPLEKYPVSIKHARRTNVVSTICNCGNTADCLFSTVLSMCVFVAGVRCPPAQSSGADGQNPH